MDAHQSNGPSDVVCRRAGLVIAVCLLMLGCVTPDPSVDLLEGELRWMEDQLYMMEDQLEQRCDELVACRDSKHSQQCNCENDSPTPARSRSHDYKDSYDESPYDSDYERDSFRSDDNSRAYDDDAKDSSTLPNPSGETMQNREIPQLIENPEPRPVRNGNPDADTDTLPPKVDLGGGAASSLGNGGSGGDDDVDFDNLEDLLNEPDIQLPEPESAPRGVRPEVESARPDDSTGAVAPLILSENVKQLRLNAARVSTREEGVDRQKLLVVVEPQSEHNRYIDMSAPVKVVLEDVNHGGVYFNSWEFSALETGRTFRESKMGRGIHLALDWPKDIPLLDDMRVSVAYRRLDGEEIRALKVLHPKVQTSSVAGWVPVVRSAVGKPAGGIEQESTSGVATESTVELITNSSKSAGTVDPFALAEQSAAKTGAQMFKTVPINSVASSSKTVATRIAATDNQNVDSTVPASWSQPIPAKSVANQNQKLTPISDVELESIDDLVFGDEQKTSASASKMPRELESIPIEAAPLETQPIDSISSERPTGARSSAERLVPDEQPPVERRISASESDASSKWTPFR